MFYVPDTHALVWYLSADQRLGNQAKAALESVDRGEAHALVPIIVLTEMLDLEEKGRIAIRLNHLPPILQQHTHYTIVPYTLDLLMALKEIDDIPEPHDRMIAATARRYDAVVLSKDPSIMAAAFVRTIC